MADLKIKDVALVTTPTVNDKMPVSQGGTAPKTISTGQIIALHTAGGHAPANAEQNVNADWDATSGDAQILNKPDIPTQYTDEQAQDALAALLAAGTHTGISFTYSDSTNKIDATVTSEGTVTTINSIAVDEGTTNITLDAAHIENAAIGFAQNGDSNATLSNTGTQAGIDASNSTTGSTASVLAAQDGYAVISGSVGVVVNAPVVSFRADPNLGGNPEINGIVPASIGAEPALGNPSTSGYVLTSTDDGARAWTAPASGGEGGSGTVTSVTAGNGLTQSGTSTINPTLDVVSHVGTPGSVGTLSVGTDTIGVSLGTIGTTACSGADARLSDARTPTTHSHATTDVTGFAAAALAAAPAETATTIKAALGITTLSGSNTGDQDLTGLTHSNRTALDLVSGTNTGDQDLSGLAVKTTTYTKTETDSAITAAITLAVVWKSSVANFAAIATAYPTPAEGWTCSCTDTNAVYRYDAGATTWLQIDAGAIPAASTSVVGKVQLTDSISSTSTSTAATPNSVKTAYDLANGRQTALGFTPQDAAGKDATGGYSGLTLFKINFKNAANTFINFLTNATTAVRTWTFPDKDGTVAMTSDITGTNSGTNTGDNAVNSNYSGLVTNATHTGDATGSTALTVVKINGTSLAGLGTGLLKNTTTTGVPSIAINSDLPAMSATVGGAVPTPPNNTTTFLRGDGTFATPGGSGDMVLSSAQSVTGAKTFDKDKVLLKGTSTGVTTLSTANTSATSYTLTAPAATDTLAVTDTAQTLKQKALQGYNEPLNDGGVQNSAYTVDLTLGNVHAVTTGSGTLTITLPTIAGSAVGLSFLLYIIQGSTARTIAWAGGAKIKVGTEISAGTANQHQLIAFTSAKGSKWCYNEIYCGSTLA